MKIAFTGSSGSGKTTLVKFVAEEFGLKHISGSAGDVKTELDTLFLNQLWGMEELPDGHRDVIHASTIDKTYGIANQLLLQIRRAQIIGSNNNFVTDRSPIDNMTYFINQCGFHPDLDDKFCGLFYEECLETFTQLDVIVYIRAVQPQKIGIENNGSRVNNWWYQQSIDAQFDRWAQKFMSDSYDRKPKQPKVIVIDFWDLDARKKFLKEQLNFQDGHSK